MYSNGSGGLGSFSSVVVSSADAEEAKMLFKENKKGGNEIIQNANLCRRNKIDKFEPGLCYVD